MSAMAVDLEVSVAEGTVSLFDSKVWYCLEHDQKVKDGKDCLWCLHEQVGDAMFK